ncbi:MAG: glycohydrolase toxin TNT-related protein [Pseudomonadota bacterium]
MGGSPHSAEGLGNATNAAASNSDRPVGAVCEPCQAVGWVYAQYDDSWDTPIPLAPIRVYDINGAVIDDGGRTKGLATFGMEDGQPHKPVRHELGTHIYNAPQEGRVVVEIVPEGGPDPAALEAQIIADLQAFSSEMETAIQPWVQRWQDEGWWGLVGSFFDNVGQGLSNWWEGEGEFWDTVWTWLKNFPAMAESAFDGAVAGAKELWDQREEILSLIQHLAEGAVDAFETGLELLYQALSAIPGLEEISDLLKTCIEESSEWAGAMIEMARETRVLTVLAGTLIGSLIMIPPNFWTDVIGLASGYLIPEVIIGIIFALIAFFSAGTLSGGLAVRLTTFVTKIMTKLKAIGRAGQVLVRIFEFMLSLKDKIVDLIKALKRKISELARGATGEATPVIRRSADRVPPVRKPWYNDDIPDEYFDPETGELLWPNEATTGVPDGFARTPVADTLDEGTFIDRYSQSTGVDDGGSFLSPRGAPYESRSLPYNPDMQQYSVYRVAKPLPVQSGQAAPWFGQPGGATQYKTGLSVGDLVKQGYLEPVP